MSIASAICFSMAFFPVDTVSDFIDSVLSLSDFEPNDMRLRQSYANGGGQYKGDNLKMVAGIDAFIIFIPLWMAREKKEMPSSFVYFLVNVNKRFNLKEIEFPL